MIDLPNPEADLNPKLDAALREDVADTGYVTRWIAIAEVMGNDGDKRLILSRGPSHAQIPIWDVRGMLYELLMNPDLFDDGDDE